MNDGTMSFTDHFVELRKRLIISIAAILAITAIAFFFSDPLLKLLLFPSGGLQLRAFSLMDGFLIKWRIALYTGIVFSFPVWAYQVYGFVVPGLTERERKAIFSPLFFSVFLFVIGAIFGYYLLFGMIRVMVQIFPSEIQLIPSADDYISFVIFFLVACGLAFQLPILLIILVRLRIVNSHLLRRERRIAYFSLFVFAEIITPVSDPIVAPLTVMIPLVILYEVSIYVAERMESARLLPSPSEISQE